MLNSKQRAKLRAMGNQLETILQVGKGGVNENVVKQVRDALFARELIKMRVLDNSLFTAKEVAAELSTALECDVVQVIGSRIILFRPNPKKPIIDLEA